MDRMRAGARAAAATRLVAVLLLLNACSTTPALSSTAPSTVVGGVEALRAVPAAGCTRPTHPGWVAAENARPGVRIAVPTDVLGGVLGYLSTEQAVCGDVVGVHLALAPHARAQVVRLQADRIGWYGGAGARAVWRSGTVGVAPRQVPSGVAPPHTVVPGWPVSLRFRLDQRWPPGFYLLIPQDVLGHSVGRAIPLVVLDPAGAEPILFKASTLTWNAYDEWGGWSLYHGPTGSHAVQVADRARVVSLQRPLTGSGYDQFQEMDLPLVGLLEHLAVTRGTDVAYTTDVSVDADPGQLLRHAEIVSGGHSEYWTTRMYDGLLAAAGRGVNLVFLGANNLWWHARLTGGTPGAPAREVVYRVLAEDPVAATDPSAATVQWQSATLGREPAAVLGESHAGIGVHGGLQLLSPPAWFTAGTRLAAGSVLPGAVGNEADGFNAHGHNPAHTQVFAVGVLNGTAGPVLVSSSYSTRPSGAAVFAAGTTDWACAPTDSCKDTAVPAATGRAVAMLTDNVVAALASPRAGLTHPANATVPLTVASVRPGLAPGAVGSYGGSETDEVAQHGHR